MCRLTVLRRGTTDQGLDSDDAEDEAAAMVVDDAEHGVSVDACMAAFFQPEPVQWDCACAPEASGSETPAPGRSALRSSSVR